MSTRTQHPAVARQQPLTFALQQEVVSAVAEGGAEVGAVLHQVTRQALPVEVAHCVGTGRQGPRMNQGSGAPSVVKVRLPVSAQAK